MHIARRGVSALFVAVNDDATVKLRLQNKTINFDIDGITKPTFATPQDSCERKLANEMRSYIYNFLSSASSITVQILRIENDIEYGELVADGRSLSEQLLENKIVYRYGEKIKDPIKTWCNLFYSRKDSAVEGVH
jgi:hypothetical protein